MNSNKKAHQAFQKMSTDPHLTRQLTLDIIREFAVDLLSMNSIEEIVWHSAKNVISKLGFEDVVIYLFDDKKQKLVQTATYGNKNPSKHKILSPIELSLGEGVVGKVALSQKSIIVQDTSLNPDYVIDDEIRFSELTVPMVVDGILFGVIDSEHQEKNFYTSHHLDCVVTIASMMATQISRFDMICELEDVVSKLEYTTKIQDSLFEIAELIFTTNTLDEFYRQLHLSIGRLTFTNNFYIALQSEDATSFFLPYYVDEKSNIDNNEHFSLIADVPSISAYVLKKNIPQLLYKNQIEKLIKSKELHIIGSLPNAWLGVPFGNEELKGLVVVQSYTDGYIFTEKDKQLLTFVAKHIYNAIERMQTKSELQFLALHDPLTKLPNRSLFSDRVEQAIVRSKRKSNTSLAVFFLDLDRFKQVNDNYGHHVGDKLLIEIAKRINACLRTSDTLCRLGGDEFAILLENIHDELDVEKIANKIINIAQEKINIDNIHIKTSVSIGITLFNSEEKSVKELLIQADEAMYRAKINGRNQVFYYTQNHHNEHSPSYKIECDFLSAIEKNEFFLEYQPIINLKTGMISNAETLVRWQHPEHGVIPPNIFLPELERSAYLEQLDLYVLNKAMLFLLESADYLPDDFRLSVNISGQGFSAPNLLTYLQLFEHKPINFLNNLCLEITEQTIVNNVDDTQKSIKLFQEMGVLVALDDFGTGYSSLSYINQFTFNTLKVDRAFINNLDKGQNNTVILDTIIKLSKALNIKTVAEGIETKSQYQFLKQLGCDFGQGYYISKELTPEQLIKLLQEKKSSSF